MAPWSVSASAGICNTAAFANSSSIRDAPSSSENSLCVWRWTKPSRTLDSIGFDATRTRERREVAPGPVDNRGENYILVIPAGLTLHSSRPDFKRKARRYEALLLHDQHLRDVPGQVQVPVRGPPPHRGLPRPHLRRFAAPRPA